MAKGKFLVTGEDYYVIDGIIFDIKRQLRTKSRSPLDPQKVISALQRIDEGKFDKFAENNILKSLSRGESLVLDALDGIETLANAKDVFAYIDSDLINWGADEKGPATEETSVAVYEIAKDATFSQMFDSLSDDLNSLCLTQAQIINFVKKYRSWLRADGYATLFLFKSHGHLFVADVGLGSDGRLEVYVNRFEYSGVWGAEDRYRLVVPQLA